MRKPGARKDIDFRGDSLEVLSLFPLPVKETLGFNLRRLQNGEEPLCEFRPMPSVGPGVYELKDADARTWYRVMYLRRIKDVIYVLHCFEKDSRRTSKQDLETAEKRLKEVEAEILQAKIALKRRKRHGGD